jgi:hypothetical protein
MPRPLRFIVIGKAQALRGASIHAFVPRSTHAHATPCRASVGQLARFGRFLKSNVAKAAGRLGVWRERLWWRCHRSIVVANERAEQARLRQFLTRGARQGKGP